MIPLLHPPPIPHFSAKRDERERESKKPTQPKRDTHREVLLLLLLLFFSICVSFSLKCQRLLPINDVKRLKEKVYTTTTPLKMTSLALNDSAFLSVLQQGTKRLTSTIVVSRLKMWNSAKKLTNTLLLHRRRLSISAHFISVPGRVVLPPSPLSHLSARTTATSSRSYHSSHSRSGSLTSSLRKKNSGWHNIITLYTSPSLCL